MSGRTLPTVWGEGVEIARNWATAHFLVFDGQPWNCHDVCGCII